MERGRTDHHQQSIPALSTAPGRSPLHGRNGLLEQLRPVDEVEKTTDEFYEQVVEAVFLAATEIAGAAVAT